jgi:hypothetical protein
MEKLLPFGEKQIDTSYYRSGAIQKLEPFALFGG